MTLTDRLQKLHDHYDDGVDTPAARMLTAVIEVAQAAHNYDSRGTMNRHWTRREMQDALARLDEILAEGETT